MASSLANIKNWLSWHYWDQGAGPALWGAVCDTIDATADLMRQALRTSYPSRAPVDALPEIAYEQNVNPPADRMTVAALRAYLADPWGKWRVAGTRQRIYAELALIGCTSPTIVSWRDLATAGGPGAFGGDSSCWYLDLGTGHGFVDSALWDAGSPALWDAGWPYVWDTYWPNYPTIIDDIRRLIRKWKPAASSCRYIQLTTPSGAVVRIPVWEWWEPKADGTIDNYYNDGY